MLNRTLCIDIKPIIVIPTNTHDMDLHLITLTRLSAIAFLLLLADCALAQDVKDEFKERLRNSLLQDNYSLQKEELQKQLRTNIEQSEVLKVSPHTELPRKGDAIKIHIAKPPEIRINFEYSNSTPVNMRPPGSVEYVQNGRGISMQSAGGVLVKPSGYDFGGPRRRSKKRARTVRRIIENW